MATTVALVRKSLAALSGLSRNKRFNLGYSAWLKGFSIPINALAIFSAPAK